MTNNCREDITKDEPIFDKLPHVEEVKKSIEYFLRDLSKGYCVNIKGNLTILDNYDMITDPEHSHSIVPNTREIKVDVRYK